MKRLYGSHSESNQYFFNKNDFNLFLRQRIIYSLSVKEIFSLPEFMNPEFFFFFFPRQSCNFWSDCSDNLHCSCLCCWSSVFIQFCKYISLFTWLAYFQKKRKKDFLQFVSLLDLWLTFVYYSAICHYWLLIIFDLSALSFDFPLRESEYQKKKTVPCVLLT